MLRHILSSAVGGILGFAALSAAADPISINYSYTGVGGYKTALNPATLPEGNWPYPQLDGVGTAVVTPTYADLTSDASNPIDGALYLDTGINTHANVLTLNFDVQVLAQSATGYVATQVKSSPLGAIPQMFGVRVAGNGDWAASFQVAPTSATGGVFGFRSTDNTSLAVLGNYAVGDINHIELNIDYTTGFADAFINNVHAGLSQPLRNGIASGPLSSEIFVYMNGNNQGISNRVAIGDDLASAALAAPLPGMASMGLTCLALVGAGKLSRRRKQTIA